MKPTYKGTYDLLTHRDAQFISVLFCIPIGGLMEMDKEHLRRSLAKAKLLSCWLEGILNLATKLDKKGE